MVRNLLTHTPHMLANYYGDRALSALRRHGDVRLNTSGRVLDDPAALVAAAGDAEIIVADRTVPVTAPVFAALPGLKAVCRVAVDISTIDVAAASRHGVLVTRATPGFVAAITELAVGFMIDLARGVSRSVVDYRTGIEPSPRPGTSACRRHGRDHWLWRDWPEPGTGRPGAGNACAGDRPVCEG